MISVIVYGRNDSHGYNLPKRAALSFNCIAEVLTHPNDEIIFVDCNTPDDLPTFPESIGDTLTSRTRELLRILRLRPASYEKGKNGSRFKVLEPLCRNVGIRRSNPANRWILNTNTDMVFTPLAAGQSLSEIVTHLQDGFYELPRFEIPEILWETMDRQNPRAIIEAFRRWGRRLHLNETIANVPEILFDGPGDFQLALRDQMFAISGMDERMTLGWHVDSNLCKRLFLLNGQTRSLLDHCYAYHCDHTRLNTVYHSASESTSNDWRKCCRDVSSPYLPEQAETWGLPHESVEEIRLTEEYSQRYARVLESLLPGLKKPMTESALVGDAFNHGLLYDNQHVLPYVTDHLTMIAPDSDIGYVGANVELLCLIADFRKGYGHTGRILFDETAMKAGSRETGASPGKSEALFTSTTLVPVSMNELFERSSALCFDFWMGRLRARKNEAGFTVPAPSEEGARFAALVFRRMYEFAKLEKARLSQSSTLTRKALFLGTQNTWAEPAVTQLFNVVMTPFSSYTRHGFIRKDALEKPLEPVPGQHLLLENEPRARIDLVTRKSGQPVAEIDVLLMEQWMESCVSDAPDQESHWRKLLAGAHVASLAKPLLDISILMAELAGQFEKADRLQALNISFEGIETANSTAPAATTLPPKNLLSRPRRDEPIIGIDAQVLFDSRCIARGAGQYALHHLLTLARQRPGWKFLLLANEFPAPSESLRPLFDLPNVQIKLATQISIGDIDLLHILDPLCELSAPSLIESLPGIPVTATLHDLVVLRCYFQTWDVSLKRNYLARLALIRACADRVFTSSNFTRKEVLRATGLGADRVIAIQAGINQASSADLLTPSAAASVLARHGITRPYFLHVGSIEPHKNFNAVLQACGGLKSGAAQLVVVGQKDQALKKIAGYAERSGLRQIVFTGFIPRAELDLLYREATALLILSSYEGLALPVLEALAHGCPILGSAAAGITEVAGDAFLECHPNDIARIGEAMEQLLRDSKQRESVGVKARHRAAQFSWEKTAAQTLAAWEELLSDQKAFSHSKSLALEAGQSQAICTSAERLERRTPGRSSSLSQEAGNPYSDLSRSVPEKSRDPQSRVVWIAPWQNSSGYAGEALAFAHGIHEHVELELVEAAKDISAAHVAGIPGNQQKLLYSRLRARADMTGKIVIQHLPGYGLDRLSGAAYHIARTMFETDRLPGDWVQRCNQMDEVWVPSQFNRETFAASGVAREKLVVIPGAVDQNEFDPTRHAPWPLPNAAAFNFLFVGQWSVRKGWDTLLTAYFNEFSADDDVCLYLRCLVPRSAGDGPGFIRRCIQQHTTKLKLGDKVLPRVEVLSDEIPQRDLPRLYKAVDCLVAPSRGEGWGRPQHEAMLMELPVIATNWSATTEFMNEANSYLLDYTLAETKNLEPELKHLKGHRWADPSETQLRQLMRHVITHRDEARAKGRAARASMIENFGQSVVAEKILARLEVIEQRASRSTRGLSEALLKSAAVRLAWEGSFLDYGSLSHINRIVTKKLATVAGIEVARVGKPIGPACAIAAMKQVAASLVERIPTNIDVVVRHAWPPNWQRPQTGAWVHVQPWEYGSLPREWVKGIEQADEVWAYSDYVRRVYVNSGVPESKVKLVPLGIDPEAFRPGITPMPLATSKKFKFLFVGGTIVRKGPDVLLDAYLRTFTKEDDVCLIIKDFGGDSVYGGQTMEAQVKAMQTKPDAPEILYLNDEFVPEQVPALYAACDCLVHPYRGEGFGLPVLEAMACGLPVIVTKGGSTDDFAKHEFVYHIPAERKVFGRNVSGMELVGDGWMLEPSLPALAERMRYIFMNADVARSRGSAASEYVRREWTWDRTARVVAEHVDRLAHRNVAQHTCAENAGIPPVNTKHSSTTDGRRDVSASFLTVAKIGNLIEAKSLFGRKQLAEAWNATIAALEKRPFHPEAFLLLAEIALAAGDSASARQCAQRARDIAPGWKPPKLFLQKNLKGHVKPDWLVPPSTPDARLSVCLITRNEEQFLAQCLKSVRDIAHQIIVTDTGSTDRTVEIAKEFGAEVHHFTWCDDFSAARNAALEHATGDWILSLDADEELSAEDREVLLKEISADAAIAYRLPIVDVGKEREGANYVPRLFRNAPEIYFAGRIHEHAFGSVETLRKSWGLENRLGKTRLIHHGYRAHVTTSRDKISRNRRLLELALKESPSDANLHMNMGLELVRSGELDAGLACYRKAFECLTAMPSHAVVPELREALLTQFSAHLSKAGRSDEVAVVLQSPLARNGGLTASLHFVLGLALMQLDQSERAADHFRQCLARRVQRTLTPIHTEVRGAAPHHCLALCLKQLNQPDAALKAFEDALSVEPASVPVRLDYARFLADQRKPVEALQILHQLVFDKPREASVWLLGGKIALSQAQTWDFARDWTGEAVKFLPENPEVLRQHAEVLLIRGESEAALNVLDRMQNDADPAHLGRRIACCLLTDRSLTPITPDLEPKTSQEFVSWYRNLLEYGACQVIEAVDARLPELRLVLPNASRILEAAMREAA